MNMWLQEIKKGNEKGKKKKTKPVANQHLFSEQKHFVLFLCELTS